MPPAAAVVPAPAAVVPAPPAAVVAAEAPVVPPAAPVVAAPAPEEALHVRHQSCAGSPFFRHSPRSRTPRSSRQEGVKGVASGRSVDTADRSLSDGYHSSFEPAHAMTMPAAQCPVCLQYTQIGLVVLTAMEKDWGAAALPGTKPDCEAMVSSSTYRSTGRRPTSKPTVLVVALTSCLQGSAKLRERV